MLTHHWLLVSVRVINLAFIVGINPHPVHFPTDPHLFFTYNRDVVFGLTSQPHRRYSRCMNLGLQPYPTCSYYIPSRASVTRSGIYFVLPNMLYKMRIFFELFQGTGSDRIAAFHIPVQLG
jgi:hypothetical protein